MAQEFIVTLIILGVLGLFDSGYLIKSRATKQPAICPIGGGCQVVLESKWGKMFGIKNDLIGFSYYTIILIFAFYVFFVSNNFLLTIQIISAVALFFSILLIFIQAKVIRQYCFYCLASALINLFIFVNVLIL